MSKQKLNILQVIKRGGIAKKTGNPWEIHAAQCVMEQDVDGQKQILVGTINLPDHLKAVEPGEYLADFGFFQSMEGKLEPRITALQAFGMPAARPKANPASV
jgi:hypothetical protein